MIKRLDLGSQACYDDYKKVEVLFSNESLKMMSKLTRRILSSIDYTQVKTIREKNFSYIHKHLKNLIEFNKCEVVITEYKISQCVFKRDKKGVAYISTEDIILDGKLELDKKTYDFKTNNRELFSFWFNDQYYPTMSMSNILDLLNPYLYKGFIGRDIIKRVFKTLGKKIQIVKPEYILGFNNGWKLPQLEEINGYTIILNTDYQRDVYKKVKEIIKK